MSEPFTICILPWHDAVPLARAVREQVFVKEQGVPHELEWDEWDARSDHALARDLAGRAIGTARLSPDGRIGRMAVRREWRRRGVGAALLEALLDQARGRAFSRVTLHAQIHAAGFYRRFGFSERGGAFLEAGIPHVEMRLELPLAPPSGDG